MSRERSDEDRGSPAVDHEKEAGETYDHDPAVNEENHDGGMAEEDGGSGELSNQDAADHMVNTDYHSNNEDE